ncbi:MAG: NAD(P)/FAD-dependent oxidoreductase [Magnetococcales bacterium]|nr:NAD(P)/FAD-dependent oxidoreductase [Magnetococcales bacterium]
MILLPLSQQVDIRSVEHNPISTRFPPLITVPRCIGESFTGKSLYIYNLEPHHAPNHARKGYTPLSSSPDWDVIILGAGASGLMCAATAGRRGRRVMVVDHARRAGEKIRVSGGGRCNFTHLKASAHHYLSDPASDPNFPQAALKAFTPKAFLDLLGRHGISHHEKTPGQLFCDHSAEQVVAMLLAECQRSKVKVLLEQTIQQVTALPSGFRVQTAQGTWTTRALVVALGGRSMPKLGATPLGYEIARQFGLRIVPTRPGLTPLSFGGDIRESCRDLTGLSVQATVTCQSARFTDDLLFTHRGLSGPVILQISSHWRGGEAITVDLTPGVAIYPLLKQAREREPGLNLRTIVSRFLPKRLALQRIALAGGDGRMAEIADKRLQLAAELVNQWRVTPNGTGGFDRAEVTVGGVDTRALDPHTLACPSVPGLYCIGEVVDVTGWLGGFNLQWAWSSGHAAGSAV